MKIRKSELRSAINEQVQAFFVTPPPLGSVSRAGSFQSSLNGLEEEDVNKEALKDIIKQIVVDVEESSNKRMQGAGVTEAAKWYDSKKKPAVGDRVHIGHKQKGGAGVEGVVTKIEGDRVDIKDPKSKRTFYGKLKNTAVMEISGVDSLKPNDPHTPEDEAEKDAADDVMEAGPKKKGGRPRGGPHIENVRFWDLPESSLKYIIKDASQAIAANPLARKAGGKWPDEVNDAVTVLHWRKKKGIKIDESFNTAPAGQGKEAASVIGTDEDKDVSEWNKSDDEAAAHGKRREKEIGSLASSSKSKALVKKMHDMVSKKLKLQSIEDVQPIKDGIAFIFGDPKDAKKMAAHLKKAGALGKITKLAAGGGKRTMVSLKTQSRLV